MLEQYREAVEARLRTILPEEEMPPLSAAMRYSLLAGGKRLRPCMLLAAVAMMGEDWRGALEYACALEMIHTYSLIHDDLPAMDNDTLRRGKPTNHVIFGEGQAVLAGDGLLNCAYERMLADALAHPHSLERRVAVMAEIARGAGVEYMVRGQSLDLACEGQENVEAETLRQIHTGKTCGMFLGAMRGAGRFCGADAAAMDALTGYAHAFGLLFQYADDLLDVFSTPAELGKSIGKDADEGKLTAVRLFGVEGTRAQMKALCEEAVGHIAHFQEAAEPFIQLAADMLVRRK